MKATGYWVAQLVLAGLFFGACVSEDTIHEVQLPAYAVNGYAVNGLVANHLAASQVADSSVFAIGAELEASPAALALASTPSGMDLLSYIVSCALPEGSVVSATVGGVAHEFHGSLGMAPAWESRGLTLSERRWVSACLLARVNAYGISVQISMRGPEELAPTDAERSVFSVAEGAFYGNIFVSDPSQLEMVACRGAGQASGEFGGLLDRDCTEPAGNGLTKCGMKYAGDCLDFTPASASPRACLTSVDGNYTNCTSQASLLPRLSLSTAEVVTVYVQP